MAELARIFLRLGFLSFGGPIAVMAMLEEEFARRRKWLSEEQFGEIYTVLKLCPGPLATQMVIYLGRLRSGAWGGVVAGVLYMLPSFLMLLGLSALYVRGAGLGSTFDFLGFQLGALVVILASTLAMSRPYFRKYSAWLAGALSFLLVYRFPQYEPLVLLGLGLLGILLKSATKGKTTAPRADAGVERPEERGQVRALLALGGIVAGAVLFSLRRDPLSSLFWMCFKAGAFVFGTGLAIVPYLEGDAVRAHHWLTHAQFMDGLALGQITPGPVTITVTFIGYLVAALPGAIVATVAAFLPSFVNVYFILPRVWRRMSRSPRSKDFTALAMPAVIGAIGAVTFRLAVVLLGSPWAWMIFLGGCAATWLLRAPGWVLILLSGGVGLLIHFMKS